MASKNYVNNVDLLACITEHKNRCAEAEAKGVDTPEIPRYAGECIYEICRRLGSRYNFRGYSYLDELISDATLDCIKGYNNFDPVRFSNPFAYFTRIAWLAMVRTIEDEHKQTFLKHKNASVLFQDGLHYSAHPHWTDPRAVSALDKMNAKSNSVQSADSFTGGASDEVINKFEEKQRAKKAKNDEKARNRNAAPKVTEDKDFANTIFS